MALGADGVALANSPMQAIGCVGARICNTNNCPAGIATQKPELRKRLDVATAAYPVQECKPVATRGTRMDSLLQTRLRFRQNKQHNHRYEQQSRQDQSIPRILLLEWRILFPRQIQSIVSRLFIPSGIRTTPAFLARRRAGRYKFTTVWTIAWRRKRAHKKNRAKSLNRDQ